MVKYAIMALLHHFASFGSPENASGRPALTSLVGEVVSSIGYSIRGRDDRGSGPATSGSLSLGSSLGEEGSEAVSIDLIAPLCIRRNGFSGV